MSNPPARIEWTKLDQKTFDRFVEALFERLHLTDTPECTVQSIDGRGGDGGIDIDVRTGGATKLIYQLKFFPEGFSGAWGKGRKPQISKSFAAAMKTKPEVWCLVIPTNPTIGERDFVQSLKKGHKSKVRIIGQASLDEHYARFPDLLSWATREPLVDVLRTIGLESAALVGPDDQRSRILAIQKLADSRNENWTVEPAVVNGVYTETLRARHSKSQENEPVGVTISGRIDHSNPELFDRAKRVFGYGASESITLPNDSIESVSLQFPDFYRPKGFDQPFEVVLPPRATLGEDISVEVRVLDQDGFVKRSYSGPAKHLGAGSEGIVLQATITGNVTFTFFVDFDVNTGVRGKSGTLNVSHDIVGVSATTVNQGLQFRRDFLEPNDVEFLLNGNVLTEFNTGSELRSGGLLSDELLSSDTAVLVEDLAIIEREVGVTLNVPATVSNTERLNIRVTRLLLEGKVVIDPFHKSLSGTVVDPSNQDLLELLRGTTKPMVRDFDNTPTTILGKKLNLGSSRAIVVDPSASGAEELLSAIAAGPGTEQEIVIAPGGGKGLRVLLPDRVDLSDGTNLTISPWGIEGIDEHSELRGITSPPHPASSGDR